MTSQISALMAASKIATAMTRKLNHWSSGLEDGQHDLTKIHRNYLSEIFSTADGSATASPKFICNRCIR